MRDTPAARMGKPLFQNPCWGTTTSEKKKNTTGWHKAGGPCCPLAGQKDPLELLLGLTFGRSCRGKTTRGFDIGGIPFISSNHGPSRRGCGCYGQGYHLLNP